MEELIYMTIGRIDAMIALLAENSVIAPYLWSAAEGLLTDSEIVREIDWEALDDDRVSWASAVASGNNPF